MKKALYFILFISFTALPQSAGNTGYSFLKFGFGARNISMGDAAAAAANDVTALFYNPARLANLQGNEVFFMHNEWIQDVRSEVGGVRSSIWGIPVALGFNVTNVSDIEIRQQAGEASGKFNANYFFGSLSTGFNISGNVSAGLTVRYIYEGIFVDESNAVAFDMGLNYLTPVKGLTAAAVVRNIGSADKLKNEETVLPSEIRAGASYNFNLEQSKFNVIASAEFLKYFKTDNTHINFGAEVMYDNLIALRGGYQTGFEARGFSAGVGLKWGSLSFDYALSPFKYDLGSGHNISLNFTF